MLTLDSLLLLVCFLSVKLCVNFSLFLFFSFLGSAGEFCGHGPDRSRVLPAGWSTPDHPQQHRPSAGLREAPFHLQQVSSHVSKKK